MSSGTSGLNTQFCEVAIDFYFVVSLIKYKPSCLAVLTPALLRPLNLQLERESPAGWQSRNNTVCQSNQINENPCSSITLQIIVTQQNFIHLFTCNADITHTHATLCVMEDKATVRNAS